MKEIRERTMVEQITVRWVSDDGVEFETEEACRFHEATRHTDVLTDNYKRHVLAELNPPMMDFTCDAVTWDIVEMKNHSDFYDIKNYWRHVLGNGSEIDLTPPETYPAIKLLAADDYWCGWNYNSQGFAPSDAIKACRHTLESLVKYFGKAE